MFTAITFPDDVNPQHKFTEKPKKHLIISNKTHKYNNIIKKKSCSQNEFRTLFAGVEFSNERSGRNWC